MGSVEEVSRLLDIWEEEDIEGRDVTPTLTKLAEIFEKETEAFLKLNLDPFDDRHPSRLQPDCTLGHMLKTVFRNERIVDEMVKVYSQRDNVELNTAVCRFLIDILPGLENVIFQEEGFVPRLLQWAEKSPNPLQSYATGLLAAAMDVPEIAANYREKNSYFVPLMLRRLHEISMMYLKCNTKDKNNAGWPFSTPHSKNEKKFSTPSESKLCHKSSSRKKKDGLKSPRYNPISSETKAKALKKKNLNTVKITPVVDSLIDEGSNSHWTDLEHYVIGSYQVYPLTLAAQQRYILQYLTPMGEYQDLIGHIFAENALPLIIRYIDLNENPDVRLAFEALKYLASLLCHKKIAIEFLNIGGVQLLLQVPYPSIAATGVSICFYYLSYIQEAMEKICLIPSCTVHEVVSYALWLLECSHDSSRCHATMFFGFAFAFRVILQHFDRQDGLRKLFNVMSTLDIFVSSPESARTLSDDQIFANRQTARHVCGALKRYFEAHLIALAEESQQKQDMIRQCDMKIYKAANLTYGNIERNIQILHDLSITPLVRWKPVDLFLNLDGVTFLLELISAYFDLSYSGRAETVRNALDVLKICSLTSLTQLKFCDAVSSPEYQHNTGISILLQAASGEMLPVADIQRSALQVIINCVCSQITTNDGNSKGRRKSGRNVEDVLSKIWKCMRTQNGIIVLINLLSTKTPLTDADSIRALACKALCELARSEHVKQIIGKLPLISDGILLDLIKEPVVQDKFQDHVEFCKYSIQLIERVTGAPVSASSESSSVLNINKSEVVAKTKVIYHENQLLQLICDHLSGKGFTETVLCLQREMAERQCPGLALQPCSIPASKSSAMSCPVFKIVCNEGKFSKFGVSSLSSTTAAQPIPPPSVPLKIVMKKAQHHLQSIETKMPSCRLQKPQICSGNYVQSPAMRRHYNSPLCGSVSSISLDSIVTEYLRKQHALCKNPMLACPPFDLFKPHNCPEARRRMNAPVNIVSRLHKRETSFLNGGYGGSGLNRKLIYSKFRLVRTYRDDDGRCDFTTCRFAKNTNKILIGTMTGALKVFNVQTAEEENSFECHVRGVANIETSEECPLVITSDGGRIGNSSLWNYRENFEQL